jgi:hypothetical protein
MSAGRTVTDLAGVLLVERGPAPKALLVQIPESRSEMPDDYRMESYVLLRALPEDLQVQIRSYLRSR